MTIPRNNVFIYSFFDLGKGHKDHCDEQHKEDKPHPIEDSLNFFSFFFIHNSYFVNR